MSLKNIILLSAVVYLGFMAFKVVPAVTNDGAFQSKLAETLRFANTNNLRTDKDVQKEVMSHVVAFAIPIKAEQIEVSDEGREWRVRIKYRRDIPLIFWSYTKDIVIDQKGNK